MSEGSGQIVADGRNEFEVLGLQDLKAQPDLQ